MSGSGMNGRLGGRYMVAMMIGPCGVFISTAMSSDVKLLCILWRSVVLMAMATPSCRSPVLFDWCTVYVCILMFSVLGVPWLFMSIMCGSCSLYRLQSSCFLVFQCSTLCCSTVRRWSMDRRAFIACVTACKCLLLLPVSPSH